MKIYKIVLAIGLLISINLYANINLEFIPQAVPALTTYWVERPTDEQNNKLVRHISNKYGVESDKVELIVNTANEHSDDKFPTSTDILAIIAIESKFNQYAKAKGSSAKGLMQVLYKPTSYNIEDNIADGTNLLKKYAEVLPRDAVIQAYNVGIGAYLSGVRNTSYLVKFKQAKKQMEKQIA